MKTKIHLIPEERMMSQEAKQWGWLRYLMPRIRLTVIIAVSDTNYWKTTCNYKMTEQLHSFIYFCTTIDKYCFKLIIRLLLEPADVKWRATIPLTKHDFRNTTKHMFLVLGKQDKGVKYFTRENISNSSVQQMSRVQDSLPIERWH